MMMKFLAMMSGIAMVMTASIFLAQKEEPELVWEDHFDAPWLNEEKWSVVIGDGCPELCGFGNNELQYYTRDPENLRIEDGILIIEAKKDSIHERAYSSAKIITKGKGDWKYGRMEIRARIPRGRGTWPAIWMLPTSENKSRWPLDGEIDIMEHVGYNQGMIHGAVHTEFYNGMKGTQKVDSLFVKDADSRFHVYAIEWDARQIKWMVDGQVFHTVEKNGEPYEGWPFDKKFHLILNLAVGGNWGGKFGIDDSIWPQRLEVDYVKVFQ